MTMAVCKNMKWIEKEALSRAHFQECLSYESSLHNCSDLCLIINPATFDQRGQWAKIRKMVQFFVLDSKKCLFLRMKQNKIEALSRAHFQECLSYESSQHCSDLCLIINPATFDARGQWAKNEKWYNLTYVLECKKCLFLRVKRNEIKALSRAHFQECLSYESSLHHCSDLCLIIDPAVFDDILY